MKFLTLLLALFSTTLFAQAERTKILYFNHSTAAPTVAEVSTVQTVADVAGALGGKYFEIYAAGDSPKYRVWIDVNNASTAPAAGGFSLLEVDVATNASADDVATAVAAALDALSYFGAAAVTDTVTVTNSQKGAASNVAAGTSGFTVGVSTAGVSSTDAISSVDAKGDVVLWKICNDAVNSSTQLYVGKAMDTETDGVALNKGKCLVCDNCATALLKQMKVSAQASANGYSVIQYQK